MIVLFLTELCVSTLAGAHNDYGVCAGYTSEERLVTVNPKHSNTIYYEAANQLALFPTAVPWWTIQYGANDPRVEQVRQFFRKNNSPAAKHARLFVDVADENGLDWRLLPAIALIETGGGRYRHNNNIFGWDSGNKRFSSVESGIRHVGASLTKGPYARKTTLQKIRVFNTYRIYVPVFIKTVKSIDPAPLT